MTAVNASSFRSVKRICIFNKPLQPAISRSFSLSRCCYEVHATARFPRREKPLFKRMSEADVSTTAIQLSSLQDVYQTRISPKTVLRPRQHPVIWSNEPGPLRENQLVQYSNKGFVQIGQLLHEAELTVLRSDINNFLSSQSSSASDPRYVPSKDHRDIRLIFEVHKILPSLRELLRSSELVAMARQILGSEVYIHQSRVYYKPPFCGDGEYWNSDFETWHAEDGMPVPRALSVSINLATNTISNGPIMIIPESHKTFVPCLSVPPNSFRGSVHRERDTVITDQRYIHHLTIKGGIEVMTGASGSAFLYDSNCMHGSHNNITPYALRNLVIVFNSVENQLKEPFYAKTRRPEYFAARSFDPL